MGILFDGYTSGPYFDEVFSPDGTPRPHYQILLQRLGILNVDEFKRRHALAERQRHGRPRCQTRDGRGKIMMHFDYVTTNGIRMHYASAGDGPLVILLHGFPEFWYSWRHQIPALAAAGFRVVAPDLRGWGQTDKPHGVESYRIETLLKDIDGLRQALKFDQTHLVGHDWGGALAWGYAANYANRVGRLAVLNCPHPTAFRELLKNSAKQRRKSWYIAFFQIPWLPEALARLSGYRSIRTELTRTVHPDVVTAADLDLYLKNVRQPGALTAGINYYRAMGRRGVKNLGVGRVEVPTRLIWGEQDAYLEREGAELSKDWAPPGTQIQYIADAGHWVQLERPDLVNRWLEEFLKAPIEPLAPWPS